MLATRPTTTVVVATRGRPRWLVRLLAALAAQQDVAEFEVVVVVDGADPATESALEDFEAAHPWVSHVVRSRRGGPGAARNTGWRRASGDVVAFTDDDCVPAPRWLATLTAPLHEGVADLAQGRTEPLGPPLTRDRWTRQIVIRSASGRFETCNLAYRRTLLEALGGFDPGLERAGEDADLGLRAIQHGAQFAFVEDALVHHERIAESLAGMLDARGRAVDLPGLVRRHPSLRRGLPAGLFWDRRHAAIWVGLVAAALATSATRFAPPIGFAALAAVRARTYRDAGTARRIGLGTGAAVADLWELAQTLRGAVRDRSLLL